jgi:diguanylate cyclase (GGDEF)-like protein/excisionase family DNA binding protein
VTPSTTHPVPTLGGWLRVQDVARLLGVSANTVRRWTDAGRIPAYRSPGGHRRYMPEDVHAFIPTPILAPTDADGSDRTLDPPGDRYLSATLELVEVLSLSPAELPRRAVRALADLSGADRCEYLAVQNGRAHVVASWERGAGDDGREGMALPVEELLPSTPDRALETQCLERASVDGEGRRALQRRGCRTLLWAPVTACGGLVGALELTAAAAHDLAAFGPTAEAFARLAAHACEIGGLRHRLVRHEKALAELLALSQEIARTHDVDAFVRSLAERLMTAVNADRVDIWRVSHGTIRALLGMTREGTDEALTGAILDPGKHPSLRATLEEHVPLAIRSRRDPHLAQEEAEHDRGWGYESSLTLPIVAGGTVVGLIDLYDDAERDWSQDLEFLTSVAQLLAGLFDNALLMREVRQRETLQHDLVELGRDLALSDDPGELAALAATRLRAITQVEDCDVWLLDQGRLRCAVSIDSRGRDTTVEGKPMEIDEYPSTADAILRREPLFIAEVSDPRVTDFEREDWAEWGFESVATLPLEAGSEAIGIVDLFDTAPRDWTPFSDILVSAARMIADALANARLVSSLRTSNLALRELVELGDALSEADELTNLARTVASRLRATLDAEDCDIFSVEDGQMRCLASIDGGGWDEAEVGRTVDLAKYPRTVDALARNEPLVIGDLQGADLDPDEIARYEEWGYRSMVSMPLAVEGRPIGLIDVFDTKVRDFSDRLDFIRNVGRLLSSAFEEAALLAKLESGNRELRLLVDSALEFGATLDYSSVLRTVAERLVEVTEADMCDVYAVHGDEVEILVSVGTGFAEEALGTRYELTDYPAFVEALDRRRPIVKEDILGDPRSSEREREEATRWGYRSALDVPLLAKGEVVGFLELACGRPHDFPERDLVMGLAHLAGQALANARLYRQLDGIARRMTLMAEAALDLASSLDLDTILLATAQRLCAAVSVRDCEIRVVEGDELCCVMSLTNRTKDEARIGARHALRRATVTHEVLATRRPTVVASRADPRARDALGRETGRKGTSWATLPLVANDQVIGVVELVETRHERTFTQDELDAAAAICHVAAMAMRNAQLYESEQVANRETHLLNVIARRTTSTLDVEEITRATCDELQRLVSFDGYALILLEDGTPTQVTTDDGEGPQLEADDIVDDGGAFARALAGQAVIVPESRDALPIAPGHASMADVRSVAVISLSAEDDLLGCLALVSHVEGAFDGVDRDLLARVGTQLSLAIKNARLYGEVKQMHLGNLNALSSALNAKDYYTLGHAARVAAYTVMLGEELGWPADCLAEIEEAAYLHDIGKISISDRVLLKPGRLNDQEWAQMREHPVFSADIIRPLFRDELVLGVRHHHERYDGGGYPDGLAGEQIPRLARAMAVVDAYDAMSCRRPYKAALSYDACLAELERCRGSQFDPAMADAFLRVLGLIEQRRRRADAIAAQAAARIDPALHLTLRGREDEGSEAYERIAAVLREVRKANPPTRYLTTHMLLGNRYVIGVDPEEDPREHSRLGDDILAGEELPHILDGSEARVNTVFADQFGVWVTGLAPIVGSSGEVVAAVAADLPALAGPEGESLRSDTRQTFASIVRDGGGARVGRAEIDAITDALTGLYNHRYLHERLSEELAKARENQQPLSLLFCDLDDFTAFNDHHGHSVGDAALREVAHLIEQSVRNVDVAARYGGEEFCVLLVETGREQALAVGERIRARVASADLRAGGDRLTLSIGAATFPEDAARRGELIEKADWAMFVAKRRGRDRIVAVSED